LKWIMPFTQLKHPHDAIAKHPTARVLFLCLPARQDRRGTAYIFNTAGTGRFGFRRYQKVKGGWFEKTDGITLQAADD
jgi:hypothetical protein